MRDFFAQPRSFLAQRQLLGGQNGRLPAGVIAAARRAAAPVSQRAMMAAVQLGSWWREVGSQVRSRIHWAPAPRPLRLRPVAGDLHTQSAATRARAADLARTHPEIGSWSRWLTPVEMQEALYLLDTLSAIVPRALVGAGSAHAALDVGSKNASHLPALHALAPCPWTLVELDAHRRYWNLVTRRSRGERIALAYDGCRYIAGSVRELRAVDARFDLITWTLPFVFEKPLAAWGLPRRFFEPGPLLAHVLSLLAPRGALVIINQAEHERDEQRRLLDGAGVAGDRITAFGPLDSPLSNFRRQRWAFCVRGS
jgi:hypothetical protein